MTELYKKAKSGKIQVWSISHKGGTLEIQYGQLNGKMQQSYKTCKPKNVGKSNETTAEDQAEREMASLILKQKDKGYYDTEAEALDTVKIAPMLAHTYEAGKTKIVPLYFMQPKLDGVRCMYHEGKLWSRRGKEYKLDHIVNDLQNLAGYTDNLVLDGEIYVHGVSLQNINSLVKDYRPESHILEYHIYDVYDKNSPDDFYSDRRLKIKSLHLENAGKSIKEVDTVYYMSLKSMDKFYKECIDNGYEGAMIRINNSKYELGQRSHGLLKMKAFQDEEFEIVNYKTGKDRFANCPIFECVTNEGKYFEVTPKGTMQEKLHMLNMADTYIGQFMKVKFFDWTDVGKPRFPVGLCIRLEDDR